MSHTKESYRAISTIGKEVDVEPYNRRIKVYHLSRKNDVQEVLNSIIDLGRREGCDKLIFYVNKEERIHLSGKNVQQEGVIRGFFRGEDAFIYSLFLYPTRNQPLDREQEQKVMDIIARDQKKTKETYLPDGYIMRSASLQDVWQMAHLYNTVFETYPTPMDNPQFIQEMMNNHVYFTVVEYEGQIVSASAADLLLAFNAAEMTDCATLPEHRNQGLLSYQFAHLIRQMRQKGVQTLFCYARSVSAGMNLISTRNDFTYGGRMVQNSNISGRLDSMNVWYKNL